ncbi:helix-turn-helix domain-containing protein [Paraburkholderia tropica]|uniref:helix-turn-helix domain-containing protein n=1 Tax=Paraburkholderia tropica TaxID=92647 RepID=UPI002AB0462F|nr:helix-turn-helix domain-containing protein [Paraburkholderia tropica]
MAALDAPLKTYEILAALHALPEQAALTTTEAALFLRLSPKTMERMRLDGSGPPYIQAGAVGSRGTNQKCLYLKADLLAWQQANQVTNAMEAALRKGQAFGTLYDYLAEAPFYFDPTGRVMGAAEDASLRAVIQRLNSDAWDLIWLPMIDAAGREWADLDAHEELARSAQAALSALSHKIAAAVDATGIAVSLRRD